MFLLTVLKHPECISFYIVLYIYIYMCVCVGGVCVGGLSKQVIKSHAMLKWKINEKKMDYFSKPTRKLTNHFDFKLKRERKKKEKKRWRNKKTKRGKKMFSKYLNSIALLPFQLRFEYTNCISWREIRALRKERVS